MDRATERGHGTVRELGAELLLARRAAGVSQRDVGSAAKVAASTVSRVERGLFPEVPLLLVARLFGVVGLDLTARAFPGPPPLRDAAHLALLGRLRAALHPALRWQTEVPVAPGDRRAWDAVVSDGTRTLGIEAETRIRDIQSLDRRLQLKLQDAGVFGVLLVLNATNWNRRVLRDHAAALANYPLRTRELVAQLRSGSLPTASGILVL